MYSNKKRATKNSLTLVENLKNIKQQLVFSTHHNNSLSGHGLEPVVGGLPAGSVGRAAIAAHSRPGSVGNR